MPKMRLGWYAGVSTALAGSVVLSAFLQRPNFYSAMVYLAQSNFCLIVLVNFTLLLYSSFLYSLTRVCFGRLRAVEVEQLTERAWFAITETCLAMTIFREEIGPWFLVMFAALVSGKIWGWIGDGRVEVLEQQPPANPRLFHTRLSFSLALSFAYDGAMLWYILKTVIQQARPNMMVMFLFEFAVLLTTSWRTGVRYLLSLFEQWIIQDQTKKRLAERKREVREQREAMTRQREQAAAAGVEAPADQEPIPHEDDVDEMDIEVPGWAAKGEWVLWLDLITDFVKLAIYASFFIMLLMFYGLPIHIIRDLFLTSRDFLKRLNALLRYRKAIQEMNKYPDATAAELAEENTCIICREEMRPWDPTNSPGAVDRSRPKKLPCGHTLHLGCLKSWLERQQVCPTCRSPVTSDRGRAPRRDHGGRRALRIQIGGGAAPAAGQAGADGVNPPVDAQGQQGDRQAGQQQQQQQQQPAANRPRVFNLGPLRLGFGANNAQVEELARQFGMAQPAPAPAANGAPAQATVPAGMAPPQPTTGDNLQNAASLLQQAEQALLAELNTLRHRQQELQTSQLLMAELQRLRLRQQADHIAPRPATFPHVPFGAMPAMPPSMPGAPPGYPGIPTRLNSPILGRHGTSEYHTSIPSGSPELPEGVTIPPGWSLMPLQRLENGSFARQPSPQPGSMPTQSDSLLSEAAPQRSVLEGASRHHESHAPNGHASVPGLNDPSPVAPSWGFGNRARLDPETTSEAGSTSTSHETPAPNVEGSSEDKGKGKAVTVEEASDDDDNGEPKTKDT
ncbi:uncharacterized protein F5Z01DRAFT_373058 [Emericellopsis atlantica]|uniref:RING-type E3 ubiquitin transferase n=1 Tax=Emericellopsis atlantica TaxID=2614577 RepID=A0A9P8CKI3_9HYPO|nr:uncharacterized protein F5Z01DRAFT_373058 [Emericellopsis atlantica]KAG9250393.1 hypothetical protein F5Z01DRAFT_373058 [Emericellopsis atlantica]